ncbi:glucan endo-1,3-beta-glucosidase 2-like [Prunus avium]|uniref:glucan endo-1,3-beta-D-glucosidase n=1 Tax=Prunus avium TaxID=42229 RepID=A0A6P5S1X4_PRUAV|nr:glucan endo-1,3-beta-glucosidase 2-like [Prunus avium]
MGFLGSKATAGRLLLLLIAVSAATADEDVFIGVNIGTDLSDMPHPTQVVALLKAQQIRHVRLYDADRGMLVALANTGIQVMISVPNEQILGIGQSNSTAANWVSQNVVAHYPATNITAIAVGSDVLTTLPNAAKILVNALKYIQSALVASNLDRQIKVSTPLSSSIILDSFPPSQAFFNRSLNPVLVPMLTFLQSTGSFLMLNIYPYYDYMQSNGVIPLDYALFKSLPPNKEAVDSNTLLHYTNVFDAVVDAAYYAMAFLNFTNVPIIVTEDTKPGPISEKNWGLFDANGTPIYILRLTGSGAVLSNDTTNQTFCITKDGADPKMLQAALDWACGPGKVDCSALLQGEPCYEPDNVIAHATYAFDTYYHKMGKTPAACDFNGVAAITTTDPSHGSCIFPGSLGKNGTLVNITAPSLNSTSVDSSAYNLHSNAFTSIVLIIEIFISVAVFL